MKTIHKQILEIIDEQEVRLKTTDKVLKVDVQRGKICVWFLTDHDLDTPVKPRKFYIKGTGHDLGKCAMLGIRYLNTVLTYDGNFVWHVFMED